MTDTANDLATLEQLHHELRIDGDGDDTALVNTRAAAVSFVENTNRVAACWIGSSWTTASR